MMAMLSLGPDSSTVVHGALMVVPPASLPAAGSLALPLLVFGATVMNVVSPTVVTVVVCLIFCSGPISVSVVAARLLGNGRVAGGLGLLRQAGCVMVVLAGKQRPVTGLHQQRPVVVALHVRPGVEAETLLGLQLAVQGLAACPVLPP